MAKTRKHPETEEDRQKLDAMAAALLELRHAAAESTPAHNRSPRWQQAIAKADEILQSHFNPEPKE